MDSEGRYAKLEKTRLMTIMGSSKNETKYKKRVGTQKGFEICLTLKNFNGGRIFKLTVLSAKRERKQLSTNSG